MSTRKKIITSILGVGLFLSSINVTFASSLRKLT